MRKKGMIWFTFILLLASFIPNLMQAYIVYAQSPEEVTETIVKTDNLNLSTSVKQVDNQMSWEIKYQMTVPEVNTAQRLKFKFYNNEGKTEKNTDANLVQPDEIEGWGYNAENWFMPEGFTSSAEGSIFVTTDLSVKQLHLSIQLDKEVTQEVEVIQETTVTEATESTEEAAVTANVEASTEVTEERIVTENILEAPHSDTHQLSAPKVNESVASESEESTQETTVQPSESTAEGVTETPSTETSQIESSPSETSSSSEAKVKDPTSQIVAPFFGPMITPFASNPYVDGFDYTTNGVGVDPVGTFPKHWTNRYLPDVNSNENIRNFNYLKTVIGRTPANNNAGQATPSNQVVNIKNSNTLTSILNSDGTVKNNPTMPELTNFGDGYVGYWNPSDLTGLDTDLKKFSKLILNKKTVKPTIDPTKFEIELDVIGGVTVKPDRLVDISFVVDKSTSMTETAPNSGGKSRWEVLKTAMNTFANGLLTTENAAGDGGKGFIRMGLASFGSNGGSTLRGEIGYFSGSSGSYQSFTNSASSVTSHAVMTEAVGSQSYTPTFLGLDVGLEMLKNTTKYGSRSNAEKVIIILTDGLPTRGPSNSYTGLSQTSEGNGGTNIRRYTLTNNYTGSGTTPTTDLNNRTISHANNRTTENPTIKRYSIGFGISGTDVTNVLKALGPEMQGLATSQADLDHILGVFADAIGPKTPYINNATINDPMSPYVTLDTASVSVTPLTLTLATGGNTLTEPGLSPPYITNIVKNVSSSGITLDKVTLSGTADANRVNNVKYGLRMKYIVTLKPEFQNGTFYQTNEPTYLDQSNYINSLGFTIPSVRYKQSMSIPIEKVWTDNENDWNTRQSITLQLQQKVGTGTWTNVSGKNFGIDKTATGNALKTTFSDIPVRDASGSIIDYRIIETPTRVTGYETPIYTPISINANTNDKTLKVENRLAKISLGKFTKINESGDKLVGVKFKLFRSDGTTQIGAEKTSNANGEVDFSDISLPVGSYVLKETTVLAGYVPMPNRTFTVTDTGTTDLNLVVNGLDDKPNEEGNQIVNKLKSFELKVTKEDNQGNPLNGADFELKRTLPTPEAVIPVTVVGNIFTFTGLAPGTYVLTETSPPSGYVGVEPMTIMIDSKGQVTIDGSVHTVDTSGDKNQIKLTVKNRQKGQLPSTGGNGIQQYLIATLVLASIAGVIGVYYVYRNRKGAE